MHNVPVPRAFWRFPSLERRLERLKDLRAYQALDRTLARIGGGREFTSAVSDDETRKVAAKIFETLHRVNQQNKSTLILVYLPTKSDYRSNETDSWMQWLEKELEGQRIPWLDVVNEMRAQGLEDWDRMYEDHLHYSEAGNRFVAAVVYQLLTARGIVQSPVAPR